MTASVIFHNFGHDLNFNVMKSSANFILSGCLAAVVFCFYASPALGWGRTGHDAITYIAECHLTPRAKKNIEKILDGKSIVYYAKWMDEIRATPEYSYTTNWHVGHVDRNLKAVVAEKHGKYNGDCILGLEKVMPILENYRNYDDSTVAVNLKFLIHLIPDMHCPVHVYYEGQESFSVYFNGAKCGYHKLWDSELIDSVHGWSYSEYGRELDRASAQEIKEYCNGTFIDWLEDNAVRCKVIYEWGSADAELGQDFKNEAVRLAEEQIMIGGYRLAHVLNSLFDK